MSTPASWRAAVTGVGDIGISLPKTLVDDFDSTLQSLVEDEIASKIAAKDATLWGPAAEHEASIRLDWVSLATESRPLVDRIADLAVELRGRGVTKIVLCGMGGSSLAPEVICDADGVELDVLDSSNPDHVRSSLNDRLHETAIVVSSKSGSTVETDSQRRIFEKAFADLGIDPADRIIVVTDPGSPLEASAKEAGYDVFAANPNVGGRYSALSAFGLVPSGLAGANIGTLLDEAEAVAPFLALDDPDKNPGLVLGAALGLAAVHGSDKVVLTNSGSAFAGFGDWAEQLIAESTGKEGKGILPVVVPGSTSPNFANATPDEVLSWFGPEDIDADSVSGWRTHIKAPLGAQMLIWEFAVAIASRVIGINPFDQPDVESAKAAARELLSKGITAETPALTLGDVALFTPTGVAVPSATTLDAVVDALLAQIDESTGYFAVHAYLHRHRDARLAAVRDALATRTGRPVTFGWGPRFLHSTGQYHKGGPATGVYLQITTEPEEDLAIPGREFTLEQFLISQAAGDATVLASHGRPVYRLHLSSIAQLDEIIATLSRA